MCEQIIPKFNYFAEAFVWRFLKLLIFLKINKHSFGEKFSKKTMDERNQRSTRNSALYVGVTLYDIRGIRFPFLQISGNRLFEMLHQANFTYEGSMPVFDNRLLFWPYALDFATSRRGRITPCPKKSYPGLWEVGKYLESDWFAMFFLYS